MVQLADKKLKEVLEILEDMLAGGKGKFLTGNNLSIADIACGATIDTLTVIGYNLKPFKCLSFLKKL